MPYKTTRGNFYHIFEVETVLAFMNTILNPLNDIAANRVVKVMNKSIRNETLVAIKQISKIERIPVLFAIQRVVSISVNQSHRKFKMGKAGKPVPVVGVVSKKEIMKIEKIYRTIKNLRTKAAFLRLEDIVSRIIRLIPYLSQQQHCSKAAQKCGKDASPTLAGALISEARTFGQAHRISSLVNMVSNILIFRASPHMLYTVQ